MTNHYGTLGLERGASERDVRRAFRRLARLHHPDHDHGDPLAADRFRVLLEAYEALMHPRRRPQVDVPRTRSTTAHRRRRPSSP